jgi:transcription initiation factor TFIID subunit 4
MVQPGQGVGTIAPGHILVKTSDGNLQLVRLAAPTANQATGAVPVHVPASMASPLGPFRFQANPTPGTIRTTTQQLPQTMSQPTIVGGSQPIVVRGTAPLPANLPSRSPTPVAVVQPQPQPANQPQSHLQQPGPPPLIQQNRVITVSGNQPAVVVAQAQPRPAAPTSSASPTASGNSNASGSGQMPPEMAKTKCKNFLATLLRLANDQPATTSRNVRDLIQGLVDGAVAPEDFTTRLQEELNSSPQPCLVPFLKKSLPYLRHSLATNEMQIEGVTPPPLSSVTLPSAPGVAFQRSRAPM